MHDENLVRSNIVSLVEFVKTEDVKGLLALILKDATQETSLKLIMKKLNLNPNLAINLVELVSRNTNRDLYNAALYVCRRHCNNAALASAFVAFIRGDLSNIRIISEALGLNTQYMSLLIACASKRLDLLDNSYDIL